MKNSSLSSAETASSERARTLFAPILFLLTNWLVFGTPKRETVSWVPKREREREWGRVEKVRAVYYKSDLFEGTHLFREHKCLMLGVVCDGQCLGRAHDRDFLP